MLFVIMGAILLSGCINQNGNEENNEKTSEITTNTIGSGGASGAGGFGGEFGEDEISIFPIVNVPRES